jgi:CubicO group peptidase (beta-lactamase class C family)
LPSTIPTGLLVMLLALGVASGSSSETPDQAGLAQSIFDGLVKPGEPGFAVLVRYAGHTCVHRGYGLRDLRDKRPINSASNFRLASFTKQFTAMAIMLLVRDGRLRYDQTLPSIWPDFPEYGKTITVRQLLNHTSGLPDYEDLMEEKEKSQGMRWSAEKQIHDGEVLALLKGQTHGKFAPGSGWAYSNSG